MLQVPCYQISVLGFSLFHNDFIKYHVVRIRELRCIQLFSVYADSPLNQSLEQHIYNAFRKMKLGTAQNLPVFRSRH